jgi:hypothetical protein
MSNGLLKKAVAGLVASTLTLGAAVSALVPAGAAGANGSSSTWNGNGAPSYLITPATGTPITAASANTIFPCNTLVRIATAPNPAPTALTAGATSWDVGNKVILSKVPTVPGNKKLHSVFHVTTTNTSRILTGNGIPSTRVGTFPIPQSSAAYKYYAALPAAGYANAAEIPIIPYNLNVTIPIHPVVNATPSCIPYLPIGVTLTGAVWHIEMAPDNNGNLYSPDSALPLDLCSGHPFMGEYHYHGYSWKCFPSALQGKAGKQSPLMGYAMDGFGIYGPRGANGKVLTNAQLDECHGTTSKVWFNGKYQSIYHYVLNNEYPYSVGCFRGTPAELPLYIAFGSMTTSSSPSASSTSTTTTTMAGM